MRAGDTSETRAVELEDGRLPVWPQGGCCYMLLIPAVDEERNGRMRTLAWRGVGWGGRVWRWLPRAILGVEINIA